MADPHCPRCRSAEVERVSRDSLLERLASLVYVYPFRCHSCLRRFRALQWGQRYVRQRRERRQDERTPVDFWSTLWLAQGGQPGRVRDLSTGGLALETHAELQLGQRLDLDLQAGSGERPIRVQVAVVRRIQSDKVGLRFVGVKDRADERLQRFLAGRGRAAPHEPAP